MNGLTQEQERKYLLAIRQVWQSVIQDHFTERQRQGIPLPTFMLNGDMNAWGRWNGAPKNMMEIHPDLLSEHPWYAVVEVVLHETAHQLADLHAAAGDEAPHGPRFRYFCALIGANPAATGHFPTLEQRVFAGADDCGETASAVALRIKKLLALSESPNDHEAELALKKARELMAKYDVREGETEEDCEKAVAITVGNPVRKLSFEQHYYAAILSKFYHVATLWVHVPLIADMGDSLVYGKQLEIYGTPLEVRIASYAYDFLQQYILQAWQRFCQERSMTDAPRMRRDFTLGALNGFMKALEEQNGQLSEDETGLVRSRREAVIAYMEARNPHVHRRSVQGVRVRGDIHEAGKAAGRACRIAPGVESEYEKRLLLTL